MITRSSGRLEEGLQCADAPIDGFFDLWLVQVFSEQVLAQDQGGFLGVLQGTPLALRGVVDLPSDPLLEPLQEQVVRRESEPSSDALDDLLDDVVDQAADVGRQAVAVLRLIQQVGRCAVLRGPAAPASVDPVVHPPQTDQILSEGV
jgi:hypothetical protein